jgi:hypothetical protein
MDKIDVEVDGKHLKLTIEEIAQMEKERREARLGIKKEAPEEAEARAAREYAEGHGSFDDVSDHFRPEHRQK